MAIGGFGEKPVFEKNTKIFLEVGRFRQRLKVRFLTILCIICYGDRLIDSEILTIFGKTAFRKNQIKN